MALFLVNTGSTGLVAIRSCLLGGRVKLRGSAPPRWLTGCKFAEMPIAGTELGV